MGRGLSEQQKQILEDLHHDRERTKRLASALRHSGMTQEQVALELGVSRRSIDEWEEGDISNVKIDKANKPDWRVKRRGYVLSTIFHVTTANAIMPATTNAGARYSRIMIVSFPEFRPQKVHLSVSVPQQRQ
jgi:DNA-binding XRE family transcriptional regulator